MYQVSSLGRVKSLCSWCGNKFVKQYKQVEKILKSKPKKNGYPLVTLRYNNKIEYKTIHRLVAETFIPNPNNYPVVNHIDGDKTNNNINNLEWCTQKQNMTHAYTNGLLKPPPLLWKGKLGKEHNRSKKVHQINKETNEIVNTFYGVAEASRETKICKRAIYAVVEGDRKTSGGYIWRYADE